MLLLLTNVRYNEAKIDKVYLHTVTLTHGVLLRLWSTLFDKCSLYYLFFGYEEFGSVKFTTQDKITTRQFIAAALKCAE